MADPNASSHPFDPDLSLSYLLSVQAVDALEGLSERREAALDRPIFVIGSPRSGTTVLGACLTAHSRLCGAEESLFLLDLWRVLADLGRGANRRRFAPLADYCEPEELLAACARFSDEVLGGLVRRRGGGRYVDHTPWYGAIIPFITVLYPTARFLHIVRDGRQVCRSLGVSSQGGFAWAEGGIAGRAALWSQIVNRIRQAGSALPPERYRELRYEELCRSPRETLARAVEFAEVAWEEGVLAPLGVAHADPSRGDVAATVAETADGRLEVAPTSPATGWPDEWTEAQRGEFLRAAGATLAALGEG